MKRTLRTVCEYAREVVTLGLMYMVFFDAIREGDGGRIIVADDSCF